MKRVNCYTANCSCCKNAVKAGETFLWGESLYICPAYPKKHKKVDAKDCGAFRCNKFDSKILCRDCRKGN